MRLDYALLVPLLLPQHPRREEHSGGGLRIVSEVRLVLLDVGVRDAQGRPVTGLKRNAFQVYDSGRVQTLAAFSGEDAPARIGLVIDSSGSMRARRNDVVAAAKAFIEESNPDDEIFAVLFNDSVTQVTGAPKPALLRSIESAPMEGRTVLFDAIAEAIERLEAGGAGPDRKALVVIGDGGDTASRASRGGILRLAQARHATIYAIGIADPSQPDRDNGFLRAIARETGGGVHTDVEPAALPAICRQIAREIRSRYTIGFHAAAAEKAETRNLRMEVRAPDGSRLRATYRRSYQATPAGPGGKHP